MDGAKEAVRTPLQALKTALGESAVFYAPGLADCRNPDPQAIPQAVVAAQKADVVLAFVGEDAGLSGEARCRAFLDLPGAQMELIKAVAHTGKPVAAIVMAGRPLTISGFVDRVQALLWAWHPGTLGGPAIVDLLLGKAIPSGHLPVTFPRTVGQVPMYYNQKNTGRPPKPGQKGTPTGTPLNPENFTSLHMDVDFTPQFPFGFGLSYTSFHYSPVSLSA